MNRNIKFRTWDKPTKKFLKDGYLSFSKNRTTFETDQDSYEYIILQESTNLFDKNQREIFEGDIIKIHNNGEHTEKEYWFPIFQVINDGFTFCLKYISGGKEGNNSQFTFRYWSKTDVEVIGNIYQNPKLIKK